MDKLLDDVIYCINKVVKFMGDGVMFILFNLVLYIMFFILIVFLLIMVFFFLIYMLKDYEKFILVIGKFFKGECKVFVVDLLKDLNFILKLYI